MAASTASACLRSDCDLVHSQSRSQACWRETSACMAVTLAQRSRPTPIPRISLPARPVGAPPIPMEKFVIEGGVPLSGTIVPAGNKNGVLPILAAGLLTEDEVVLRNVPRIADAEAMALLLETLGATVEWLGPGEVSVNASGVDRYDVDRELAERIRASFLLAGPLLARFGHAHMPPPGGDVIGRRRLDPHLDAFRALGATVTRDRHIKLEAPLGLRPCDFLMDEPSVMGTENALMAAALTRGPTVIRNAASEPHVQDLARLLLQMGARVEGIGSNVLIIHGRDQLRGADYRISPGLLQIGRLV